MVTPLWAATSPSWVDKSPLGINFFTFFNGPGLHPDTATFCPNQLGNPSNDGLNTLNQVSFRYKFSENFAFDFQTRFYVVFNNHSDKADFSPFRWEAPRFGISGTLLSGSNWKLEGAINSDFPYFLPSPFTGYQARQRTVIFNPGLFAKFIYAPSGSRWSVFSVISPRYFFYTDRNAAEPQLIRAGFQPQSKPELIIAMKPTLNYSVTEKLRLTLGTNIDFRKLVMSSWNFLDATLITNGQSPSWILDAIPLAFGVTYSITPHVTIFPYIATFPIATQRFNQLTGTQASFLESGSMGMWINGKLL